MVTHIYSNTRVKANLYVCVCVVFKCKKPTHVMYSCATARKYHYMYYVCTSTCAQCVKRTPSFVFTCVHACFEFLAKLYLYYTRSSKCTSSECVCVFLVLLIQSFPLCVCLKGCERPLVHV